MDYFLSLSRDIENEDVFVSRDALNCFFPFSVCQPRLHGTYLRDCGLRGPELPDRRPARPLLQRGALGRVHHVQGLWPAAGEGHQEVGRRPAQGHGTAQRGQNQGRRFEKTSLSYVAY